MTPQERLDVVLTRLADPVDPTQIVERAGLFGLGIADVRDIAEAAGLNTADNLSMPGALSGLAVAVSQGAPLSGPLFKRSIQLLNVAADAIEAGADLERWSAHPDDAIAAFCAWVDLEVSLRRASRFPVEG